MRLVALLCIVALAAGDEIRNCEYEKVVGAAPPGSGVVLKKVSSGLDEDMDLDCVHHCLHQDGCKMAVRVSGDCRLFSDPSSFKSAKEDKDGEAIFLANIQCGTKVREELITTSKALDCADSRMEKGRMPVSGGEWVSGFAIVELPSGDPDRLDLLCAAECFKSEAAMGKPCKSALRRANKCELLDTVFTDIVDNAATSYVSKPQCTPIPARRKRGACGADEFTCDNGECVDGNYQCDLVSDCADGSDESHGVCAKNGVSPGCAAGKFACNDGACFPNEFRCDDWQDCAGGEDESGCGGTGPTPAPWTPAPWTPAPTTPASTCHLVTGCKCGAPPNIKTGRIVGGVIANRNGWPWLMELQKGGQHYCGASLLRVADSVEESDMVVTALHCIESQNPSGYTIIAGQHSIRTPESSEQTRNVVAVRALPGNKGTDGIGRGDFAILRLDRPIKFNSVVQPVCLPPSDQTFPSQLTLWVSGWGSLSSSGRYPDRPRQVSVPLMSDSSCRRAYPSFRADKELCAGFAAGEKDSCQGDSGGPLSYAHSDGKWYLGGIVSWGEGCAAAGKPGVYTRVTSFVDFFTETMCNLSSLKSHMTGC